LKKLLELSYYRGTETLFESVREIYMILAAEMFVVSDGKITRVSANLHLY
jgi:hypothetical protein